ncbi:hypothetical protein [Dethiothermospora halolimnae]|uniref:hypothetical protein n=1 Tax=Dethiothermospora halolimnae TaxID=3114390 RepID=UPI003CCC3D56
MNLKKYSSLFLAIILLSTILFTTVYADDNKTNVGFEINYGGEYSQYPQVTLCLENLNKKINVLNYKIQFSLDKKTWMGYNSTTQSWEEGYQSNYQPYYPNFNIGKGQGIKIVYVKIFNGNDETIASDTINYSPEAINPTIEPSISIDPTTGESVSNKGGITRGNGSKKDPYVIRSNNTSILLKALNSSHVKYSVNTGSWSDWKEIKDETIDVPIKLTQTEGLKRVLVKTKNRYGVESRTKTIYYLIDSTPANIDFSTKYHSFVAVEGNIDFDLEIYDNLSDTVDFTLEIYIYDQIVTKKGRIQMYVNNKPTTVPMSVEGLPSGNFIAKVIVKDGANNVSERKITINSIE